MSRFQLQEVYKALRFSKIIQSQLCTRLDNTSPRLASTFTSAAAPGSLMSSRLLPFRYRLARVHQEDCSSSLVKSRPLLKNVRTVSTIATFLVAVIYIAIISVANVIYLITFPLHKSLAADVVTLGTGFPLWHGYQLWCSPRALVS